MSQPLPSGRSLLLLQVLRKTIREVGFDRGSIIAVMHEGRFTTITLTSKTSHGTSTHGLGSPMDSRMPQGSSLSAKQMGEIFLVRMNQALDGLVSRFADFEFEVAGSDVVNTKVTLRVRPNEEEQLSLL